MSVRIQAGFYNQSLVCKEHEGSNKIGMVYHQKDMPKSRLCETQKDES